MKMQVLLSVELSRVLLVFGLSGIGFALDSQHHAPLPRAAAIQAQSSVVEKRPAYVSLAPSQPVAIDIPSISVTSPVIDTGLNADGSPAVPSGDDVDKAAWLTSSVTPGETGTSVIIGHVDSLTSGPSVFFNLGNLVPGQEILINRQDGQTAVFRVSAVQAYDKSSFPDKAVYGSATFPALRLITCGGAWDEDSQQYAENVVAYASLAAVRSTL
jgi:sortase (surface protein transpeptidase)